MMKLTMDYHSLSYDGVHFAPMN